MRPKKGGSSDDTSCSPLTPQLLGAGVQGPHNAGPTSGRSYKSKRTVLTRNACIRCRSAKTKCNGKHPSCARCVAGAVQCVYDVTSEGITKMQDLQQKLENKTQDLDRAMTVIGVMQRGSDHDATEILARLRLGDPLEKVVKDLESREEQTTISDRPGSHAPMQRSPILPPIPHEPALCKQATYTVSIANSSPCTSVRRDSMWPTVTRSDQTEHASVTFTPSPSSSGGSLQSLQDPSASNDPWLIPHGGIASVDFCSIDAQRANECFMAHESMASVKNTSKRAATFHGG